MSKKRHPHRVHPTPLVQVVELGPDFWCDHCGKFLDYSEFSDFTDAGIEEQFSRAQAQFEDTYGHGLS